MKQIMNRWWLCVMAAGLLILVMPLASAKPGRQASDPVARGKYLTTIAGCIDCHTPLGPDGKPDTNRSFAGGFVFDLGPAGKLYSKNLTSDKETGLGDWTDDQIKIAIRTGVDNNGVHLFPVMPYLYFNNMADADIDAIVAFLRTLPPISNKVPDRQLNIPTDSLPQLPYRTGLTAPDPSDIAARGKYLLTAVIACSDCHTPVDEKTGQPIMAKYLAGGQAYIGPWGTVYGANLTPDKDTGIGSWSDDDIKRVLHQGVLPASLKYRRVQVMPWYLWSNLTDQDTAAIVYYLRNNVQPVSNLVPAPNLNPGFAQYAAPADTTNSTVLIVVLVAGAMVVAAVLVIVVRRRSSAPTRPS